MVCLHWLPTYSKQILLKREALKLNKTQSTETYILQGGQGNSSQAISINFAAMSGKFISPSLGDRFLLTIRHIFTAKSLLPTPGLFSSHQRFFFIITQRQTVVLRGGDQRFCCQYSIFLTVDPPADHISTQTNKSCLHYQVAEVPSFSQLFIFYVIHKEQSWVLLNILLR